tara:strand:- start:1107 stop:1673 length:567 start_codon:yes stop_codon:yes gene_type:complete
MNKQDILATKQDRVRKELEKVYPQLLINVRKVTGAGYKRWGEDLLPMAIEMYLEKPIEYQIKVIDDGKLENFITYIMSFQLRLGTTRFWHHYRKFNESIRDFLPNYDYGTKYMVEGNPFDGEEDICTTCINSEIEKLNVYEKMLIKEHVLEGKNFSKISKQFNITYTTLKKDCKEVLERLNQLCKHLR